MLTIFNRRQLLLTTDLGRQAEVRNILSAHGIAYIVRTKNCLHRGADSGRGSMVNVIADQNCMYEYRIYVHRDDYEKAAWLIR